MAVKILVFGKLAEITGLKEFFIEEAENVEALKKVLEDKFHKLRGMKYAISVNRVLASHDTRVCSGDEIALMPPFSGG